MSGFGADEIRIGEVLYRCEAHLVAACELFGMGRKPDALLQSARPITDVLPSLETEMRSAEDGMRAFFAATAQVGAGIRRNVRARPLRGAMKDVEKARGELLGSLIGDVAATPEFRASVAVALLTGTAERYRAAVTDERLDDYQACYAIGMLAVDLMRDANLDRVERMGPLLRSLHASLPEIDPPSKLTRHEDFSSLVEEIAEVAVAEAGAVRFTWTIADSLGRIDRVVGDVVATYERGHGPLAARLAASVFVRLYDPIRHELSSASPDETARLTTLLGFELRTAINRAAPATEVRSIAEQAQATLRDLARV
jgi:hypothetical protein